MLKFVEPSSNMSTHQSSRWVLTRTFGGG